MLLFLFNQGAKDVLVYDHSVKEYTLNSPEALKGINRSCRTLQRRRGYFAENEQPLLLTTQPCGLLNPMMHLCFGLKSIPILDLPFLYYRPQKERACTGGCLP